MSDRAADARLRIVVADVGAASPAGARTRNTDEVRDDGEVIRSGHASSSRLIGPIGISGEPARI